MSQNSYQSEIESLASLRDQHGSSWSGINPEFATRMKLQNRFHTGLDIARYTAAIMRRDMADYDGDSSRYTQSLGCWHGFIGQQKMIAIKKHHSTTSKRYLYLSGWMVAGMRSKFGPLPDQSMHEKNTVPELIEELYTFLKQADARELNATCSWPDGRGQRRQSDGDRGCVIAPRCRSTTTRPMSCRSSPTSTPASATRRQPTCWPSSMIEAGACAIQIENQVSDAKQCGHQDGKVTVPHEDFVSPRSTPCRYAFLELGVSIDGIIVARTDSLGAGLTQKDARHP